MTNAQYYYCIENRGVVSITSHRTGESITLNVPHNFSTTSAVNSKFGASVVVVGSTLLVGASGAGVMGNRVYVYNIAADADTTLAVSVVQILNGLIPDSQYGASIYAYDTSLVIGAPGADRAYIYKIDESTGQYMYQQKLVVSAAGSTSVGFGQSVSMASDSLIVGASGSAYIYELTSDGNGWKLVDTLHPTTGSTSVAGSDFGISVSMIDNMAIVGDSIKSKYKRFNQAITSLS